MPSGYSLEIAAEAIRRTSYEPNLKVRPWERAQQEALKGDGVLTGFSKTPERENHYLFSDPILMDHVLLVSRKDQSFTFTTYNDLKGKTLAMSRGSNYSGKFAQQKNQLTFVKDEGTQQRILLLASGRVDAAIFSRDRYLMNDNAKKAELSPDDFEFSEKIISRDPNFIGIPRSLNHHDAKEVKRALDKAIQSMREDGTIDAILSKY
ncbi:MAG: transporter substrate-binding domain-containing protein [Oleiphilaceae bacterium]|nr:transporter substrate-binding domain-containing protein [Oleiphilaceae bacterium]